MNRSIQGISRFRVSKIYLGIDLSSVMMSGCSQPMSWSFTVPKDAVQSGLDAWLPVELTDYVEEEVPVKATLVKAMLLNSDGSDRLGIDLSVDVYLPEVNGQKLASELERKAKLPPPPFGSVSKSDSSQSGVSNSKLVAKKIQGQVAARVGVRYDEMTASFYCDNATAEKIRFDDLPVDLEPVVKRICEKALQQYFKKNSIYKLTGEDSATSMAKAALKSVAVKEGELVIEVGW